MKIKTTKLSIDLVWACAWCSSKTYAALKKGQEYTHGICIRHKNEFISNVKARQDANRRINGAFR